MNKTESIEILSKDIEQNSLSVSGLVLIGTHFHSMENVNGQFDMPNDQL